MIPREYFSDKELACKCGCGLLPDQKSIEKLYALRILYGRPIIINSGARCEAHNKAIGGSSNSPHLIGAYDCKVLPEDEWGFIQCAQFCGFNGIGINNNKFIHIDDKHEEPQIWTY